MSRGSTSSRRLAQAAGAAAPAAAQTAAAPAPTPTAEPWGGLVLAPANITAVRTLQQLQRALAQAALDIEIRAHLDLTPLLDARAPLDKSPQATLLRTAIIDPLALLQAQIDTRSIRGNCSDADAAAALGLGQPEAGAVQLLPLQPFQCLLLLPDTFLAIEKGRLWLDNLYLKLHPKPLRVLQALPRVPSFLTVGRVGGNHLDVDYDPANDNPAKNDVLFTNITFQGDEAQGAHAIRVASMGADTKVFLTDCIFTDWGGRAPPVVVSHYSSANIARTLFRNMHQAAEMVDVSFGGLVRFEDVLFADADLPDAAIVGTSMNDYQHPLQALLDEHGVYYAADDDNYDVVAALLPPGDGGAFSADHVIGMAIMSDCLFQDFETNDTEPQPGCPPESVAARAAVAARLVDNNATLEVLQEVYYEQQEESGTGGTTVFGVGQVFGVAAADPPEALFDYEYATPGAVRVYLDDGAGAGSGHGYYEYTVAPGAVLPGYDGYNQPLGADYMYAYAPGAVFTDYADVVYGGNAGGYDYTGGGPGPDGQPYEYDVVYGNAMGAGDYQGGGDYDYGAGRLSPAERLPGLTEPNKWTVAVQRVLPARPAPPPTWPAFELPEAQSQETTRTAALLQPISSQEAFGPAPANEEEAGSSDLSRNQELATAGLIIIFFAVVLTITVCVFLALLRRKAAAERTSKRTAAAAGGMMTGGVVGRSAATAQEVQALRAATLVRQLDLFGEDDLFLDKYELLGRSRSCRGSDTFVQYARGYEDGRSYAIKFFFDRDRFAAEATLQAAFRLFLRASLAPALAEAAAAAADAAPSGAPQAGDFLPQVADIADDAAGTLVDPRGRPLPPCIVMDKGLSLQEWTDSTQPDLFTALAMLSSVSKRLASMHDAGYVHCDLKPANVMMMTSDKRWTVVGLSRAARAGAEVPLRLTLAYAAPEAVRGFANGDETMVCAPELDAWALGVIAFELLTGAPAFRIVTDGQSKVIGQLKGDTPLPWEGSRSSKLLQQLGMLRSPVLRLLERVPAHRASAKQFHNACNKAFADQAVVDV